MPVFNMVGGGGSSAKLDVVAYASSFPESAPENTIGIISTLAVNGCIASNEQPTSNLKNGLVWIKTASSSSTPIPVTDSIFIYPRRAYQYNGSTWNPVEAKAYQSGWKTWRLYLFDNGAVDGFTWDTANGFAVRDNYIELITSSYRSHGTCEQILNLEDYTSIYINHSNITGTGATADYGFCLEGEIGTNAVPAVESHRLPTTANITSIDITSVGSFWFKIATNAKTIGYIYQIWLE